MQNNSPEQPYYQSPMQQEAQRRDAMQSPPPPPPYPPQSAPPYPPQLAPMPPGMPQSFAPPPPAMSQAYAPPSMQPQATPPLSPQAQKQLRMIPTFQNILQRELNLPSPLPYWVEDAHAPNASAGGMIGDTLGAYFGGSSLTHILTAHFKLPWHSTAELHVRLNRHGPGLYAILLYTATLRRPVPGEVILETPKLLSWSKFVGEPRLCQKLNSNNQFIMGLNKFARTEETYHSRKIKISRFARLGPQGQAQSQLAIRTLPRKALGFILKDAYHFDSQQFLAIAATVESMLTYP